MCEPQLGRARWGENFNQSSRGAAGLLSHRQPTRLQPFLALGSALKQLHDEAALWLRFTGRTGKEKLATPSRIES